MPDVKKRKAATIHDVAKHANVAVGTVSRFLNGETLRKSNRERIEMAVAELNFRRNLSAASLRRNDSKVVGFILPYFDEFHTHVLNLMTQEFIRSGYVVLPYINGVREIDMLDAQVYFKEHRIDALITSGDIGLSNRIELLQELDVPLILYSNDIMGLNVDRILIDDQKASQHAVQHMIDMGHRKIAILRGDMRDSTAKGRYEGYRKAMMDAGLKVDPSSQIAGNGWLQENGYQGIKSILEHPDPATAVFCSNYMIADGVFQYLAEENLRLGKDISLVSFGDSALYPYIGEGVTVVRMPDEKIARSIVDFSVSRLKNDNIPLTRTVVHSCELVVRGSVKPI